ncbi:MAG: hypothetical protein AAFQ43_00225 [Bacteroidota bacterium]
MDIVLVIGAIGSFLGGGAVVAIIQGLFGRRVQAREDRGAEWKMMGEAIDHANMRLDGQEDRIGRLEKRDRAWFRLFRRVLPVLEAHAPDLLTALRAENPDLDL